MSALQIFIIMATLGSITTFVVVYTKVWPGNRLASAIFGAFSVLVFLAGFTLLFSSGASIILEAMQ